jgi:hypothetical protein
MAAGWVKNSRFGSANRKVVMLVIADYATEDASEIGIDVPEGWAVAWVSIARIADDAELSPATVRRVLADMQAAGVIRREHRGRRFGFGGRTTDAIWIHFGRSFVTQSDLALNLSGKPVDDPDPVSEPDETAPTAEPVSAQIQGGYRSHPQGGYRSPGERAEPTEEPPTNRQDHPRYVTPDRARARSGTNRSSSDGGPDPPPAAGHRHGAPPTGGREGTA